MLTNTFSSATFRTCVLFVWPLAVSAAPATFGQAVAQITVLEWVLCAVLSILPGLTSLLLRFSNAANSSPPKVIREPWSFVGAHMGGSITAGLMAFFGASHFGFYGLSTGLLVIVFSFGGAFTCEKMLRRFMGGNMTMAAPPKPVEDSTTPT